MYIFRCSVDGIFAYIWHKFMDPMGIGSYWINPPHSRCQSQKGSWNILINLHLQRAIAFWVGCRSPSNIKSCHSPISESGQFTHRRLRLPQTKYHTDQHSSLICSHAVQTDPNFTVVWSLEQIQSWLRGLEIGAVQATSWWNHPVHSHRTLA